MIFFYLCPNKLQNLIRKFFNACKEHSQEWRIAQLLDAITNAQIIVRLLTLICLKINKDERVD